MPKIVYYMRERDAEELKKEGKDPAEWLRDIVNQVLKKRREKSE